MPRIDTTAVAVNAAGIADAFRTIQQTVAPGEARMEELVKAFEGWIGVVQQLAEAGELMERFRATRGATATWGGELPYIYDAWESIALALWVDLGKVSLDVLVDRAIEQTMVASAA